MKLYACGVDWQHEIGEAPDLDGKQPLYSSIEALKKKSPCWESCGIVEVHLSEGPWHVKQDLWKDVISSGDC
jgi:hypothetical protein